MAIKMNVGEALIDAVMGYAIVFLGIALLVLVVALVGKAMTAKAAKPLHAAPAPAPAPVQEPPKPTAPGASGDLKLYDTPDRDAAMIMAIVADELKIPINELRFISIREVHRK